MRCKKCGLPDHFQGIRLDREGICNYCRFFEENEEAFTDKKRLKETFEQRLVRAKEMARANGSEYDCLVGLSGGKDSTYIIHQLKNVYGMRVLAFTYDNGYTTDFGRENVQIAVDKLGVDHITCGMDSEEFQKYNKFAVRMFSNFCMLCFHMVHFYSHKVAAEKKIPLIVNGRTKGQILQFAQDKHLLEPFEFSHNLMDYEYQMFGDLVNYLQKLHVFSYLPEAEVDSLSYFMYHDYDAEYIKEFLHREIGWIKPREGSSHADCWGHLLAEQMMAKNKKYPIMTGELAVMVRFGEITRAEAIRQMEKLQQAALQPVPGEINHKFQQLLET